MKTALITGASSDIGSAIAKGLFGEGYSVILTSRTKPSVDFEHTYIKADLSNESEIENLVSKIDTIDVLVNVAAIWHGRNEAYTDKGFLSFDWSTVRTTMEVGILAPMKLIHTLGKKINQKGNIINISGTFESGGKGWVPYYVSKKALEDLTYALADDLSERDVRVNGISPSDTATSPYKKFFPEYIDEAIQPEDIAKLVIEILNKNRNKTIQVLRHENYTKDDIDYLNMAIEQSKKSSEEGCFPAGAVVVRDGIILAQSISGKYPNIHKHAESNAVEKAIEKVGDQLTDATLYDSMEPCLMCLNRAFWTRSEEDCFCY